ncbi:hypothetical protein P8452_11138 [Trifolium repens]|nr:hypothetical protein P8452_11138 [Trifolium repens]
MGSCSYFLGNLEEFMAMSQLFCTFLGLCIYIPFYLLIVISSELFGASCCCCSSESSAAWKIVKVEYILSCDCEWLQHRVLLRVHYP